MDQFPSGERLSFRAASAFGAAGDGVTDDTVAIQTAIDRTPDGGVVYFPVGTYSVFAPGDAHLGLVNKRGWFTLEDRRCLSLRGDGHCSVIRRADRSELSDYPMFVISDCEDLAIEELAIDGNGVPYFTNATENVSATELGVALAVVNGCRGFRVERTRWFDSYSAAQDEPTGGAVAILLGGRTGTSPQRISEDVSICDNAFDRLGLWVSQALRLNVSRNEATGAPGFLNVVAPIDRDLELADVEILDNEIRDSTQAAIAWTVEKDHRRVRIARNRILDSGARAIEIRQALHYGAWNMIVEGNLVQNREGSASLVSGRRLSALEAAIMVLGDDRDLDHRYDLDERAHFRAPVVRNNTVIGFRSRGITVTGCDKSTITGNAVLDCQEGLHLEALKRSHIAGNRVSAITTAFALIDSLGFNVFGNNAVLRQVPVKLDARQVFVPQSRRDTDLVVEPVGGD